MEKITAYLKDAFAGKRRYVVKMIEYQRRGLPQTRKAIALENPPTTPEEIDSFISRELPEEEVPLREHDMVHRCNHSCRPQDPQQDCIKGCPWTFAETTSFDERGYPHHRRRPCGGHCPNCSSGGAVYGGRAVCLNWLVVEYNAKILLLWDGHANIKFAGCVELFEYL